MKKRLTTVFIWVFLGGAWGLNAQDSLTLTIISIDKEMDFVAKKVDYQRKFRQSQNVENELNGLVTRLQEQAYLTASIDSVARRGNDWTAFLFVGERYEWATLNTAAVEPFWLAQIGFRERAFQSQPIDYQQVVKLKTDLLTSLENHGYPFASVRLAGVQIEKNQLSADLVVDKGPSVAIHSIEVAGGNAKISKHFLALYLDLQAGELYDESKIQRIRKRLNDLPFLREKQPFQVIFIGNSAKLYLFLDKQKASRFDFLVGFLPQNEETGQLTLTGNVELYFQNLIGRGELFHLRWQQLRAGSPQLDVRLAYPYLLRLPLGVDASFHLYKRDSSYLDVRSDVGVQYLFQGGNYFKAFLNNFSTNLLTINELQIIQTRKLPTNLDVTNASFGLELYRQNLDYRFNPRRGNALKLRAAAGLKQIRRSNLVEQLQDPNDRTFDFGTLYDSLPTSSLQVRTEAQADFFLPLGRRSTLKLGIQAGFIFSADSLYRNELYRIGGNRLLRGFDEEAIFASQYAVATLEGRLLTGQNSYLFAFLDYAFARNYSIGKRLTDFPIGFGIGITLELGAGVLSFSVATGRQLGNPIDFQATKIHAGFISFF